MSTYREHYQDMAEPWDFPKVVQPRGYEVEPKDSPDRSKLALMLAMMDEIDELKKRVQELERRHYNGMVT